MELSTALHMIREHPTGVLGTIQADGSPHLSVVSGAVIGDGIWISLTESRAKTRNLRREPRATFLSGLGPWAAVEGHVTIHDGADALERLRLYYKTLRGEHPDWDDYDRAMREDRRLIAELTPARAYGFAPD